MSNKKYYSFETSFRSLKDELRVYLKANNIYYELSGCCANWHFEILCDCEEVEKINSWLDENTITRV